VQSPKLALCTLELTLCTLELTLEIPKLALGAFQLRTRTCEGAVALGKLGPHTIKLGPDTAKLSPGIAKLRTGVRPLLPDIPGGTHAQAFELGGALPVHALGLRGPFGTHLFELGAGGARMADEVLGEARHLAPGSALLARADAELALELGKALIGEGGRLVDLYDRARAGGVVAHDGPSVKPPKVRKRP
jgi:hypothetical protein